MATARLRVKGAKGRSSRRGDSDFPRPHRDRARRVADADRRRTQVERDYSSSAYLTIQRALTSLSNGVPIALFDVLLGVVTLALIVRIVMRVRQVRQTPRGKPWRRTGRALSWIALDAAAMAAVLAIWFSLAWGGNYRRMPLRERLDFDRARVTREAALEMTRTSVREIEPPPSDRARAAVARARGASRHARRRVCRCAACAGAAGARHSPGGRNPR